MRASVFARRFPGTVLKLSKRVRCRSHDTPHGSTVPALRLGGPRAFLMSSMVSCVFCGAGDLVSQVLVSQFGLRKASKLDALRIARMAGFGLVLYGPIQHVWYRLLGHLYPTTSLTHFLPKLVLNQVVLGPIAVSMTFLWVLTLTKQTPLLGQKFQQDFFPTLTTGWKFWVPAATVNFTIIPLRFQVLYMSLCSVCWSAYLGYEANKPSIRTPKPDIEDVS